jgi:hypothetical protein
MSQTRERIQRHFEVPVSEGFIGERRLWTAVIVMAVEDWRTGTLRARREAQRFLLDDGEDFNRVCAAAGLEPTSLRAKLVKTGHRIDMEGPWQHQPLAA